MGERFDYIIVGAGSAGCLLANRLSADPRNNVLLLEAGGKDDWIWFHIPVGYLFAIGNPRSDWMFQTEAVPGLNGRRLNYPRGKVIGGSSAINAMIYMRGQAADYDGWRQMGLTGWGWDDVLPYFLEARRPCRWRRASPSGRGVAHRASAHALESAGCVCGCGGGGGHSESAGLQHGRQFRRGLFPGEPEAGAEVVVGARLPAACACGGRISSWKRVRWWSASS